MVRLMPASQDPRDGYWRRPCARRVYTAGASSRKEEVSDDEGRFCVLERARQDDTSAGSSQWATQGSTLVPQSRYKSHLHRGCSCTGRARRKPGRRARAPCAGPVQECAYGVASGRLAGLLASAHGVGRVRKKTKMKKKMRETGRERRLHVLNAQMAAQTRAFC